MRTSLGQMRDFVEGVIWKDIVDELSLWIEDIRDQLEDPGHELFPEDIKRLQGNVEALRRVLELPKNLILNLEDELEESNERS